MRILKLAFSLVLALTLAGCTAAASEAPESAEPPAAELAVSAAATLADAFTEIATEFEAATGTHVTLNTAASGVLQKQIEQGAPVDVFASASPKQVDALIAAGLVSAEETATFASNTVALIVPAGNPAGIGGFEDLATAQSLATGNPETAPHGASAMQILEALGLREQLEPRFVFAENAAQTVDYVARGEVDAGIVFTTEALGRDDVEIVATAAPETHKPIRYVIVPVGASEQPEAAAEFVAFVTGERGRAILAQYGFELPATAPDSATAPGAATEAP